MDEHYKKPSRTILPFFTRHLIDNISLSDYVFLPSLPYVLAFFVL